MNLSCKLDLLHLDGCAGLTVGILLLLLKERAGELYNLPSAVIIFLSIANICYGTYAASVAFSKRRQTVFISLLAIANIVWAVVCAAMVIYYAQQASLIGLAFISLEALFVIGLAWFEWKNRFKLSGMGNTE